ncbi:MAG: Asparagine-rich protein (ARP protein) [Sporothrix epigloea]
MASNQQTPVPIDRYVVIHVATTCDEHGVYVTKDSAEVIEIGWILLDSKTLDELYRESVLVKPINTPITPLCTSLTTLTWEHVRNAGSFRDAVNRFDTFASEHLTSQNLDFVFVTLDAWDLRVQLPREARDKAVVLPPYMQHSRTFDLRQEYQRWQHHHPESLPFGPSSLANICAALEVEAVQSSAPIKHNLPFHLQALAPASPRRAMEEAVTLARVLRGLIRKSQPLHEHADVLARPMDARADVRAFLSERSKVLHMSGLPHDTTQSELESWFTQFGGRPIAFWTLRTPEQHKPTGTGFAVFSSHEEAAESLCMNGRALNEKAIEVSPSSSRVLDRAAEILTPFPPSKNRPRPGDWTCPSCGFSNFQRRTACFRCSFPAVSAGPTGDMSGGGYYYGPQSMMPPQQHHGNHHNHNHGHSHGHGHGHGHMGGGHNGGRMGGGGVVPFRAGDWKCGNDACGYHNFAKNVCCLRCGASRASAAVVADSGYPSPMDGNTAYNMNHGAMGGNPGPGPGPFASGGGPFASGGGGGYGQHFGGPPSTYALPSGLGGNNAAPYPPLNTHYGPVSNTHSAGPFDSRAAEAAFQSATNGPASAGSSNNFYSQNDPFAFLSSGMGGLSVNNTGDPRQNGSGGPSNKSPA